MKKFSLSTTLFTLATMTLMVMTVGSSGLRGRQLQSISIEGSNILAPSVKISGVSTLLQILNAASNFTNSTFDVLTLDSFSQNVTDQGVVYDGKVTIANDQGFNVSGVINGTWDPTNGNLVFNVAGAETSESEGEGGEGGSNTTNSTAGTPPVAVPTGYTWIAPEDLPNNALAQGALSWGVDALVAKAISQYKLPAADPQYNVTNLILAAYKNASYGSAYIFWTNLTNDLNYKIDANITVKYFEKSQTYNLAGYSFHSYGYPASAIVIPPPVTVTNTTNSTSDNTSNATDNSTAPSNTTVTVPDNTTSTVPDNTTVIVDNSTNSTSVFDNSTVVTPIPTDNSTNVTVVVNNTVPENTTVAVPQTTSDGYTIYTPDQLANDSQAQAALQYGANALIAKGISQNKIPAANPNYTINNVGLAAYKKQTIGTYYKFQVNMTNVDLVHVDASLTILYRYSTKALSLNGYSFHSYNYSSKALSNNNGNTNTTTSTPIANTTSATNTTIPVATISTDAVNATSGSA